MRITTFNTTPTANEDCCDGECSCGGGSTCC